MGGDDGLGNDDLGNLVLPKHSLIPTKTVLSLCGFSDDNSQRTTLQQCNRSSYTMLFLPTLLSDTAKALEAAQPLQNAGPRKDAPAQSVASPLPRLQLTAERE